MSDLLLSIDKGKGLDRKERQELVDILRKNFLYQTPKPIFADDDDGEPRWVGVRMLFSHQQRMLRLLHKAGGWVLPADDRNEMFRQYEERSRSAYGEGSDYDFSNLSYGDLVQMHAELEGVEDDTLVKFREAIGSEIVIYRSNEDS